MRDIIVVVLYVILFIGVINFIESFVNGKARELQKDIKRDLDKNEKHIEHMSKLASTIKELNDYTVELLGKFNRRNEALRQETARFIRANLAMLSRDHIFFGGVTEDELSEDVIDSISQNISQLIFEAVVADVPSDGKIGLEIRTEDGKDSTMMLVEEGYVNTLSRSIEYFKQFGAHKVAAMKLFETEEGLGRKSYLFKLPERDVIHADEIEQYIDDNPSEFGYVFFMYTPESLLSLVDDSYHERISELRSLIAATITEDEDLHGKLLEHPMIESVARQLIITSNFFGGIRAKAGVAKNRPIIIYAPSHVLKAIVHHNSTTGSTLLQKNRAVNQALKEAVKDIEVRDENQVQ